MTRKLLVGAIAVGALAVTAGTAFALSSNDGPASGASSVTSSLTQTTDTSASTSTSSTTSAPTSSSPTSTSDSPTSVAVPGGLSAADAGQIALARMGGTVHEIEREVEHGRLEWKVELTARDGNTYDVRVDAQSGAITRVDQDSRGGGDDRDGDRDRDDGDRSGHGGDDRGGDDHGGHGDDD